MRYSDLRGSLLSLEDRESGNGADTVAVAEAEEALGVAFPPAYRSFLGDFGWLAVGADEVFGLGTDVPQHLHVVSVTMAERQDLQPGLPLELVPVLNDGGGNLYCIDSASPTGAMAYRDHEDGCVSALNLDFVGWLHSVVTRNSG